MFNRLIDVVLVKPNGEALVLVDHTKHPNTFICSGSFSRYCSTECDKLEISIYNLPASVRGEIALGKYSWLIVKHGYSDDSASLGDLFIGNIQRSIYKKPDEVSNETKLWVYDTGEFKATTFFSATYSSGMNYYAIAEEISKEGLESGDIKSIQLSNKLKDYAVYSSKTFYADADACMQEVAEDTGMIYKKTNSSLLILSPEEIVEQTDAISFSVFDNNTGKVESRSGLVGIPELTNTGLEIDCLVNAKLGIYKLLQIDNSVVSIAQEGAIPSAEYGAILDPDGIYVITAISGNFSNDGRSNTMHVTAVARSMFLELHNNEE